MPCLKASARENTTASGRKRGKKVFKKKVFQQKKEEKADLEEALAQVAGDAGEGESEGGEELLGGREGRDPRELPSAPPHKQHQPR
eukprot:2954293-Rhodomonas_salina.1